MESLGGVERKRRHAQVAMERDAPRKGRAWRNEGRVEREGWMRRKMDEKGTQTNE